MGTSRKLEFSGDIPKSMKKSKVYGVGSKWAFHEGKTGRPKESKWTVCESERSKGQRLVDLKGWN